jgi:hypothetical protein
VSLSHEPAVDGHGDTEQSLPVARSDTRPFKFRVPGPRVTVVRDLPVGACYHWQPRSDVGHRDRRTRTVTVTVQVGSARGRPGRVTVTTVTTTRTRRLTSRDSDGLGAAYGADAEMGGRGNSDHET